MPAQSEAGASYISFTISAPAGTGSASSPVPSSSGPRCWRTQSAISGEYQISAGAWVP